MSPLKQEKRACKYQAILKAELLTATGCTEPIAIAYASALARAALGHMPERIQVLCSGNIVKNVKSVVVPSTGGLRGIPVAALIGAIGGDETACLDVLHAVNETHLAKVRQLLADGVCTVELLDTSEKLLIKIMMQGGGHTSFVEIKGTHTHVTALKRDGNEQPMPYEAEANSPDEDLNLDYDSLTIHEILEYARRADLSQLAPILEHQLTCNTRVAFEGLKKEYGLNIGRHLLSRDASTRTRARAMAAAGSDARMGGCALPVVINSGSGNQGLTVSIPVAEYAFALGASHEQLLRALVISNLTAVHIKHEIGRLSAFCGAVSAACGAGAAITWLYGGTEQQIACTISNTLANVAGIVCDGAKPSCAAKIASALDAALLGHELALEGKHFAGGDGLVCPEIEDTIHKIGQLGGRGMRETDRVILDLMMH